MKSSSTWNMNNTRPASAEYAARRQNDGKARNVSTQERRRPAQTTASVAKNPRMQSASVNAGIPKWDKLNRSAGIPLRNPGVSLARNSTAEAKLPARKKMSDKATSRNVKSGPATFRIAAMAGRA